jgi:DNA-binding transcriptional LysR family regulator
MKELRSFDSLAAILATARSGGPSKAASALGRAPSSIYRAIERVEEDIGAPLFQRAASGWKPTEAGLRIMRLGERMEAEIAEAELSLLSRNRQFPAPLRVSTSDGFASYLGPILAAFAERQRDIVISLTVNNDVVDLMRRQADVAVRPDMRPGEGVIGQRAGKLAHALYGSTDLLERQGAPTSFRDLSRYRICSLAPALAHFTTASWWQDYEIGSRPKISFIANTETALASAIAAGLGIGALPRFIGDRLGGVKRVPAIQVGTPVDIWLVTHPTLRENAVVRSLIRALAAAIRKDAILFSGPKR